MGTVKNSLDAMKERLARLKEGYTAPEPAAAAPPAAPVAAQAAHARELHRGTPHGTTNQEP